jgi:hypothetical protein
VLIELTLHKRGVEACSGMCGWIYRELAAAHPLPYRHAKTFLLTVQDFVWQIWL